jgi:hypothetical protein
MSGEKTSGDITAGDITSVGQNVRRDQMSGRTKRLAGQNVRQTKRLEGQNILLAYFPYFTLDINALLNIYFITLHKCSKHYYTLSLLLLFISIHTVDTFGQLIRFVASFL